jgi:cobalt-zinc-cadmium efflux system outer membrane protein
MRWNRQLVILLLPVMLAACAHQYADLAPTEIAPSPQPSVRVAPRPPDEPDSAEIRLASHSENKGGQSDLTLEQLEQIALESNPTLMQLAAVVDKARGIHEQVGLYPNPTVGYTASEIGNEGHAGQQGGFVGQTIVTGGKLRLNQDVAGWNIQELSWEYQAQRLRVRNDVRRRFYDVVGSRQRMTIAADLLRVADAGATIAEQLFKAKQASRADVLQARIELNRVRIIQQNAKLDYDAAWRRLTAVIGRPHMPPRELAGELTGPLPQREWQPAWEQLVGGSPQLQAARSRVQRALMEIRRQEVQPIPNLNTQLSVQQDDSTNDTIASVQIGVPLPVFNWNQGNLRVAQAEYHRTVRDAQRLELQLRDGLATAFKILRQAENQVARYRQGILDNARESLKLTEESYKAGQVSFLRVLTARRTYFEANLQYVEALISLRQAEVVIDGFLLTGGLTDVPDIASRPFSGLGQRGQALSGQ